MSNEYDIPDHMQAPAVSADAVESARQTVEVEQSLSRAGGGDLHPSLPPIVEVHIDRAPDIREVEGVDEDVRAKDSPAYISIATWTIIAVFAFWIICQIVPLFMLAISYSGLRFYAAVALLLIPVALLAFVSFRVYLLFRKLPSFPQVVETGDKSYESKDKLLNGYLEELPDAAEYAAEAGFEGPQKDEVVYFLNKLHGEGAHYSDEIGWLNDFKLFTGLQRSRANKVIGRYGTLIGLKTAASPWKIVDIICVLFNSTLMVADIAKVYHRRIDRSAAFRLVFRWFLNIYISGELGRISENVAGAAGDFLKEPVKKELMDLGWMDGDWARTVANSMPFVSKYAGKVVEGGVNAFFAIRMGRRAIAAFEPLITE